MRPALFLSLLLASLLAASAQAPVPLDPVHRDWKASWITHPTAPLREPIVLRFRREIALPSVPASYPVRVSADNRFILSVNGKRVGDGPARGDLSHWRYEVFDLAPYLQSGKNLVTATVWNFGIFAPVAQMTDRTAFLLESEAQGDTGISTPKDWQVKVEPGHTALDRTRLSYLTYYASGPGEQIDASQYDWNWDSPAAPGSGWVQAGTPMRDSPFDGTNHAHSADEAGDNPWGLVQDLLPHMEFAETSPGEIRRASTPGGSNLPDVPTLEKPFSLLPNSHYHLLLDRKTLTTAYPQLTVSGGKGARIVLTYAEALYDDKQHKGDRDAIDYTASDGTKHPREARGITDAFLPDGGGHRSFEPLWWRTWRYLDLDITTADEPLKFESLKAWFTAYPFEERANLHTGDPGLDQIWNISWRTARMDAHETYMDTPYYEQLQYVGDTRLQALISYTVAGDDRLGRQALDAFRDSLIPEGITRSRYPSSLPQNIPTFSLLWIGMVHDWWMYRPDPAPVRESLDGTRSVLHWFGQYENPDGLLRKPPWWSFIDWVPQGKEIPTYSASSEDCVTTMVYLGALDQAADLEQALGDPHIADQHRSLASHVRSGVYAQCWSAERGLLADNSDRKSFSQQANILAVLYDVIPKEQQKRVLTQMLAIEPSATAQEVIFATYYFRFYLARALDHAGMADSYLQSLQPWRDLLPMHFSTWPEVPGDTRSDSHAWSAHPIYDLLTLVAGIEPAKPGFAEVRIEPHMGALPSLDATFPHPAGPIHVEYQRKGSALDAVIHLPGQLAGTFVYNGKSTPLHPGVNRVHSD